MGNTQCSILGHLLFSLHIYDLPDSSKKARCQMYADDTVVFVSARTTQLAYKTLSEEMSGVSQGVRNNHLTLNYKSKD